MKDAPDLLFPPGPPSGFTPTGLSGFNDMKPAAVVRELLQNSLDAATEAGEQKAIVRFCLDEAKVEDVPGYERYVDAFEKAVKGQQTNGSLPDIAQGVVNTIEDCLTRQTCTVLSVLDNGIGLDQDRMTALLSDGSSVKGNAATGSYGNGHMVAVPTSDLRYVLYGGISRDGRKIGAGHAVLASHPADDRTQLHPNGADGFLVCGFSEEANKYFKFGEDDAIPPLIADRISDIKSRWGHGAAVIIPWFNNFRDEERPLHEMVFKAAACNFFAAIEDGRLEVTVEDSLGGSSHELTRSSLPDILTLHEDERRAEAFLRGKMAQAAWKTICDGEKEQVDTAVGSATICLRYPIEHGNARVDLCRNGMWIVDDKRIPGFYGKFGDRQPFHAVILIDSLESVDLHRLIRKAEPPLHDDLSLKLLQPDDKRKLRNALDEIRVWLKERVPETSVEEYSPDDVLNIETEGGDGPGSGARHLSFWGSPVEVGKRLPRREQPGLGPGVEPNPNPVPVRLNQGPIRISRQNLINHR